MEEDDDTGIGWPPILHQIHYMFVPCFDWDSCRAWVVVIGAFMLSPSPCGVFVSWLPTMCPCCCACRFIQVAYPTSAEGLQAAGVLEADALLLAAEESTRGNSAEADAQVRTASIGGRRTGAHTCFMRGGGDSSRNQPEIEAGAGRETCVGADAMRLAHRPQPCSKCTRGIRGCSCCAESTSVHPSHTPPRLSNPPPPQVLGSMVELQHLAQPAHSMPLKPPPPPAYPFPHLPPPLHRC